jgi:integral membrane sensor domain MASE1
MVTRPDARDIFTLLGWLMLTVGGCVLAVWFGLMVGGAALYWLGVTAARAAAREVTSEHPG